MTLNVKLPSRPALEDLLVLKPREPEALERRAAEAPGITLFKGRAAESVMLGLVLLIVGALGVAPTQAAEPQESAKVISTEDIQRALQAKPKGKTRGFTIKAKEGAEASKGMIDLDIPFELNSSDLQSRAMEQLQQLGAALKSAALADSRFKITGHTDARGKPDYNKALSLRRAESVRGYLESHGVDRSRLEVSGAGAERLLRPNAPEDAVNRRVEIRNLATP